MKQNQNNKLGRGISALFGSDIDSSLISSAENIKSGNNNKDFIKYIPLAKIVAGVYQPRILFDDKELNDLSDSIKENGIIQPIVVRQADDQVLGKVLYEIVAGERRFRASKLAGLVEIPAIIKDISNNQALEIAIVENVQRLDLSAIEEGEGYRQLMEEFSYTQQEVSNKVGKSRSYIANILRLLKLPEEIQEMVQNKTLSASHARRLVGKENALEIARNIVSENIPVRSLDDGNVNDYKKTSIPSNLNKGDLQEKNMKDEYLKTLEDALSEITGGLKVKAIYNNKNRKGKITISFKELEEVENIINKLEGNGY